MENVLRNIIIDKAMCTDGDSLDAATCCKEVALEYSTEFAVAFSNWHPKSYTCIYRNGVPKWIDINKHDVYVNGSETHFMILHNTGLTTEELVELFKKSDDYEEFYGRFCGKMFIF